MRAWKVTLSKTDDNGTRTWYNHVLVADSSAVMLAGAEALAGRDKHVEQITSIDGEVRQA